ncbi:MAG: hypothetical protein M3R55_10215 [Acidobacteriota bacterium]|nr:hypothetical protein [Acidobacteriota bacterium]
MAQLFSIKKGARLPSQTWTLASTAVYDLDDASSVYFVYRKKGVAERVAVALVVVNAATKTVRLDLGVSEVDTLGEHQCHVEVTIGGLVMPFPHLGFDTFKVTETIE